MPRWLRRAVSIPTVIVLLPLCVLLSPIALVYSLATDLPAGRSKLPTFRLWVFLIVFIAHEWIVIPLATALWIHGRFGRALDIRLHSKVQGRWVGSLLRWAGRLLDVSVDWPDTSDLPSGRVVVLSRHASMIDAVIPAHLFPSRLDRPVHYVLKRELQWLPSIDLFGHRLGNHFVDRSGDTDREVAAIVALLENAEDNAGVVIFPEGTYATPATRAKVRASLEKRGDTELVEFADQLHHLLPPKPAGALALLQRVDQVVLFGHIGLEGVAEFKGLRHNLPSTRPIRTRMWTHRLDDLPDTEEARLDWLRQRWLELDAWVSEQHRAIESGPFTHPTAG